MQKSNSIAFRSITNQNIIKSGIRFHKKHHIRVARVMQIIE
jgi:hypothetical protein